MVILFKRLSITMFAIILCLIFYNCAKEKLREVMNKAPEFSHKEFISFEKLYSIDVTNFSLFNPNGPAPYFDSLIDFDENNNMYILDTGDNVIIVFDNSGKIVNTFGGTGLGPTEFNRSNALIINDKKIYVFEFMNDYKVVNLKGEYITKQPIPWVNRLKADIIGNVFYVFEGRTERTFTDLDLVLSIKNMYFSQSRDIIKYKFPPGFKGPDYEFVKANWILLTKSGEFYVPEDNLNTYSIVRYNKDGKPLLKFGRKYKIENYSEEAKNRFVRIYKSRNASSEFPVSPPVVRNMIADDHGYIWVISGETRQDNNNPDFENTIDIFNKDGVWIYSFKSRLVTKNMIYNDGNLYLVSPIDEETQEQFIHVYRINYMSN